MGMQGAPTAVLRLNLQAKSQLTFQVLFQVPYPLRTGLANRFFLKNYEIWSHTKSISSLALTLVSCIPLSKLLCLFVPETPFGIWERPLRLWQGLKETCVKLLSQCLTHSESSAKLRLLYTTNNYFVWSLLREAIILLWNNIFTCLRILWEGVLL